MKFRQSSVTEYIEVLKKAEFRVGGIPCRRNSVSMGEFRVDGGIPCRQGNSMSTGEFHVNGEIPCRRGNSVSTGEFHACRRGIPC
jgi:formylmethanofuran dehydrogenase subunit C